MMASRQLRPGLLRHEPARLVDGVITSLRQFSVSSRVMAEGASEPPAKPESSRPAPRPYRRPNNPQNRGPNTGAPRQRAVDARSLAASQGANAPGNVLRGPRFRRPGGNLPNRSRGPRAGPPSKMNQKKGKDMRPRGPRRQKQSGEDEDDVSSTRQIDAVYEEIAEKERPTPTQYTPVAQDFASMKETWPSLPIGVSGQTAGVYEKLSWLSERYPNGYVAPWELGRQLIKGQNVRFSSEEEKAEAIEEAKKLAQQRADKLSQKKGDLIEPRGVSFNSINEADRKVLLDALVKGSYPKSEDKSPVLGEISRNLLNNATYQTTGKSSQFVDKVQSLLSTSRPAKRA